MRVVSHIDEEDVIERILRHLGLWQEGCACIPAPTPGVKRPDPWRKVFLAAPTVTLVTGSVDTELDRCQSRPSGG